MGAPRSVDAFWEALEYTACVMACRSVHLNTSWFSNDLSVVASPSRFISKFDIDDRREIEDKRDSEGDTPPSGRWCEAVESSLEAALDDCGVKERRRETVGCRNGFASLKGWSFGSGDNPLDQEMSGDISGNTSSSKCCVESQTVHK